ncbi:Cytoplasmic tRNA 2-thiolation protein 2 [Diplodia intermedia]|uniref:Cytoplasmic tRNA 2-thiolation protein 2 n=1 Tax=Diplodia intermedia TaxID=856260 RepID=A0ABR3T724_9PEZI
MPGKHVDSDPAATGRPCQRCRISEASIIVRTEPLCRDCFVKYVNTKAIKRMESYAYYVKNRSANEERKLLLPVSFGVSSVTLLYLLDEHLKRQTAKTGRTGYALHVLFVDTAAVERDVPGVGTLEKLKEVFPGHEYSSVALADIFENSDAKEVLQAIPEAASADISGEAETAQERLERLILSLPSATSRSDVITILKNRVIVNFAQNHGCKGILWGDSTTKIAEKTLAETAKGRGFSLPWQVSDGMSPYGIVFNYPVRDLLKKELVAHAQLTDPPLTGLIHEEKPTQVSASAKNTTIDDLMKQYFESVERDYPSIVANVVRTSSKLEPATTVDDRCQASFFERLLWIAAVIAAPEIILFSAWEQRCTARKLQGEINQLGQRAYDAEDIDSAVRSYEEHLHDKTVFSPWTLNDAFLAVSGGLTVDSSSFWTTDTLTFTPAGILELARAGLLPPTRPSTVPDKSKRDSIAIFLVVIQCLWFTAQFLARLSHRLPVTLLEITTLTHLLCTLAIAGTWARKPWNAASNTAPPLACSSHERQTDLAALFAIDPHLSHTLNRDKNRLVYPIDITEATEALTNATFSPKTTTSRRAKRTSAWQLSEEGHAKVAELHSRACRALEHLRRRHRALVIGSHVGQSPPPPSLRFVEPHVVGAGGRSEWRVEGRDALMMLGRQGGGEGEGEDAGSTRRRALFVVAPAAVAAALLGAVVLGVSCVSPSDAAAGFFPTDLEKVVWRAAGIVVVGVAVAAAAFAGASRRCAAGRGAAGGGGGGSTAWKRRAVCAAGGILGALYVAAKLYLLVEAFASLRAPPQGTYEDVAGVRWVPHVG